MGMLAVGKWKITPKMLIFALTAPFINYFYAFLVAYLIKLCLYKSTTEVKTGVSMAAGLLAAMHNPRVVQAMIQTVLGEYPSLVQEMFMLPFICTICDLFWAVVIGKLGVFIFTRCRARFCPQ